MSRRSTIIAITVLLGFAAAGWRIQVRADSGQSTYVRHFESSDGVAPDGTYDRVWSQLRSKCRNPPSQLTIAIDIATRYLHTYGIDATRLQVMQQLSGAIPARIAPTSCEVIAPALLARDVRG